jgi:predicted  nucleic acid-binding Zn-ribbon protein
MIKNFRKFINENIADKVKDDLAQVIDINKQKKDIENIQLKIEDAKKQIETKKTEMQTEVERMEKIETEDYSEENQKLLKDKIEKFKTDIASLEQSIALFDVELKKLKT